DPGRAALAQSIAIGLSLVIGCISFAGSLVAFAKLQELIGGRPVTYPAQKAVNAAIAAAIVILAASISFSDGEARLVAAGALAREESRGAHARRDFPRTDAALDGRHSVIAAGGTPVELASWR
ncbi:MAG TPA: NAD(P)(+) transhydrogenase (Re/Si-specific) subunit beta, partial [Solirubrobacteraceae bacterium]|nr:NAD(P)(+) transhydrogenase (Re/Si-specific) subunit beta [Solirubrobacteraceae bacterium]